MKSTKFLDFKPHIFRFELRERCSNSTTTKTAILIKFLTNIQNFVARRIESEPLNIYIDLQSDRLVTLEREHNAFMK